MKMLEKQKAITQVVNLLKDLEDDFFGDNNYFYLSDTKYTKNNWKTYIKVLEDIQDGLRRNSLSSVVYLKKNPDYNRTQRLLSYYRSKPLKKPKDYAEIERLQRKIKRMIEKKNEKNDKIKAIEEGIKNNFKEYEESGRVL